MQNIRLRNCARLAMATAAALIGIAPIMAPGVARAGSGFVVAQAQRPTGQGTLNAIDDAGRTLNITHGPIAALNWPGMTMDFGVAPGVNLKSLKPGQKIAFTLSRGADGIYVIDAIKPAE